jgi:hypothetical protein
LVWGAVVGRTRYLKVVQIGNQGLVADAFLPRPKIT